MSSLTVQQLKILKTANKDSEWVGGNYQKLLQAYDNQFIAIKDKKVLAANPSVKELLAELEKKGYAPNLALIKYISNMPMIL